MHRWLTIRVCTGILGVGAALLMVHRAPAGAAPPTSVQVVALQVAAAVPLVAGTPCTAAARVCVDLTKQRAWLFAAGKIVKGPVPTRSGGPGEATPQGTFTVSWKDRTHVSIERGGVPMPDAVFFAAGGIALHEGPLTQSSAGCVHLRAADAADFYNVLRRGDQVQVRAPGGDPIGHVPAAAARPVAPAAPAAPHRRVQPGIPGVPTIGPAPD